MLLRKGRDTLGLATRVQAWFTLEIVESDTNSLIYMVLHHFGDKALILCLWQVSAQKDLSGTHGHGRARRCPETKSEVHKNWLIID